ncbi:MAG TPA: ATP-binding protein [Candidatus Cloacimonas acidaminovorans]|nr:ATP-binding protein [Candidatus Cloacimonas acidaminovorans]
MKIDGIEPVEILHKLIELKPMKHDFDMEDEPETTQNAVPTAIDASNAKLINKHIRQLIRHPLFESYCLSQQDVMVIADLWQFHLELPGRGSSWISICSCAKIRRYQVTECLKYITGLLERNIICFDEKIAGNYYLNPMILQSAEYTLSNDIILRIMGRDIREDLELVIKESWQNDKDFISDLRLVFDLCYNSFGELGSRSPVLEHPILSACLNLLKDRILAAPDNLGIKALVRQNDLNDDQLFIVLVVMYHQLFCGDRITEADLSLSLAPDPRFRWLQQQLLSADSVLISSGLISREQRYHRAQVNTLGIPDEILKSLGYSPNTSDGVTTKISSYFQKSQPNQTINDVIIPAADKQLISQIITKCRSDKRRDLENWGFKEESNKQGVVLLLYGAPGTGKTFTAGAIANELHRDLLSLNVPELRNKYYGETEKLIKKAFCEMREMAAKDSNAPVFLLNEADQLIHKRIASTSTCSTIENSIQSIILEELETFPGILILTTNLETNLDEAFFRRFDLKFKFKLPDLDSRRNLWRMYLRKEIPGSEDIDVELLAQRYQFSGAQIAMVVQNACIEAITRNGKSKRLYLQDLLKYADLEEPWGNKVNKSIGF